MMGKGRAVRVSKADRRRHSQSRGIVAQHRVSDSMGRKGGKGSPVQTDSKRFGESIHTEYWVRNGDRAMSAMGDELYGKIH